jgi:hypothetical protein
MGEPGNTETRLRLLSCGFATRSRCMIRWGPFPRDPATITARCPLVREAFHLLGRSTAPQPIGHACGRVLGTHSRKRIESKRLLLCEQLPMPLFVEELWSRSADGCSGAA